MVQKARYLSVRSYTKTKPQKMQKVFAKQILLLH